MELKKKIGPVFWDKGDFWGNNSGKGRFMHNNYCPLPDSIQVFTPEYHIQTKKEGWLVHPSFFVLSGEASNGQYSCFPLRQRGL